MFSMQGMERYIKQATHRRWSSARSMTADAETDARGLKLLTGRVFNEALIQHSDQGSALKPRITLLSAVKTKRLQVQYC